MATENQPSQETTNASQIRAGSPQGSTALAAGPAPTVQDTGSIPVPAPAATPAQDVVEGIHVIFDGVLAFLVLVLAFFLGSFAATNPDLWMTLATGKNIAHGEYQFGVDPFSFATEARAGQPATPWINQQWLSALIFYLIYSLFGGLSGVGGAALVILKAGAVTLIALLLLRMRSSSLSRGYAILAVALALLALSTRVLLQPTTLSYLFLAITLWLLYRDGALGALAPGLTPSTRALWGLPILFFFWVNMDGWFILGPIVIGLLWAGSGLGLLAGVKPMLPGKKWAALFFGGLAVCLLNPHHVRAFALPPDLGYLICQVLGPDLAASVPGGFLDGGLTLHRLIQRDPTYDAALLAPVSTRYFNNTTLVSGLAMFALIVVCLVSFLMLAGATKKSAAPGFAFGRLLLFLFFALLGLSLARLIPFFAVAMGAVAVRNFDEWLAWRTLPASHRLHPLRYTLARSVRWVGLASMLSLVVLAWPGWLHVAPGNLLSNRRVSWQAAPDASLQQAAERLAELRKDRTRLHVFNFNPDFANYCAWFSPGVKCYFDVRFPLFTDHAETYNKIRLRLQDKLKKDETVSWEQFFQNQGIDLVALTNFETEVGNIYLAHKCWADPGRWRQEYGDGRTLLFAHEGEKEPFATQLNRQAFGLVPEKDRAPQAGTPSVIGDRTFADLMDLWYRGTPPRALASSRSFLFLVRHEEGAQRFDMERKKLRQLHWIVDQLALFAQNGIGAASPAAGLAPNGPLAWHGVVFPTANNAALRELFPDLGPPALPLLAVRQARLAVEANPHHYTSYLALSKAYTSLLRNQEEYWLGGGQAATFRANLRQVQLIAALYAFLELNTDDAAAIAQAHFDLSNLYHQQYFHDAALKHRELSLKYFEQKPPNRRNERAVFEFKQNVARRQGEIKEFERDVKKRRTDFELKGAQYNDLDRVRLALFLPYRVVGPDNKARDDPRGMGLALEALKILEKIQTTTLVREETEQVVNMQIHLMLNLGRVHEVQKIMPDLEKILGPANPANLQYRALLAGALGDYAEFDKVMVLREDQLAINAFTIGLRDSVLRCALMSGMGTSASQLYLHAGQLFNTSGLYQNIAVQWCGFRTLRGLMALEQGDTAQAARLIQSALDKQMPFQDRPIALRYNALLKAQGHKDAGQK